MKLLRSLAVAACVAVSSTAFAIGVGLNPASPLGGFDLGGGQYATLIGVQSSSSLVGQTITLADLNNAIISGSVLGFYYGPGTSASAMFANIDQFSPFVSDTVVAGAGNPARLWDSLYAVHTGTVVFNNGWGGTNTMGTGGTRIQRDPFTAVPDTASTLGLLGFAFAGLALIRRKQAA